MKTGMGMKKGEGIFGPGMKVSKSTKRNLLSTKIQGKGGKKGGVNMSLWAKKYGKPRKGTGGSSKLTLWGASMSSKVKRAAKTKVKKIAAGMKY